METTAVKTAEQLKAELDAIKAEQDRQRARAKELREALAAMKKPAPKISRYAITAQVVLANTGKTVKELAALADAAYVSAGGKANEKESEFTTGRTVSALAGVGLVKANGTVIVVGRVVALADSSPDKGPDVPDTAATAAAAPQGRGRGAKGK